MYAAILPFGLSFVAVFSAPASLSDFGLLCWLISSVSVARFSLALYHVPHMAQGAELSDGYAERSRLAASRVGFSVLASFLVSGVGFGFFFRATPSYPAGQLNHAAYQPFGIFFGTFIMLVIFISAYGTHRHIDRLHRVPRNDGSRELMSTLRAITRLLLLRSYRLLLAEIAVYFTAAGAFSGALLYLNTYFWTLRPEEIMLLGVVQPVGIILGLLMVGHLARNFEKLSIMIGSICAVGILQVGPILLRVLGIAPANGTLSLLALLIVAQGLIGAATMQRVSSSAALMADIADELEYLTQRRQEGLVFSGVSICETVSGAFGGVVLGFIIDGIAFPRRAEPGTVPEHLVNELGFIIALLVLGLFASALIILQRIDLSRGRHLEILEKLRERRGWRAGNSSSDRC